MYPRSEKSRQRPTIARPENLDDPTPEERDWSDQYWNKPGIVSWNQLTYAVDVLGLHIGLIPAMSGLVVLDCDVKKYAAGDGYVYNNDGSVGLANIVVKHGIDDLASEVEKLGHSLSELKTYTVETKSKGYHLYFKQNPRYLITDTIHHRNEWRIDVIAGANSWVAAPPTPGYRVATDVEVLDMPDWLAEFLLFKVTNFSKPGGERRQRAEDFSTATLEQIKATKLPGNIALGDDLWSLYLKSEVVQVVLANRFGGWNNAIYHATLNLLRAGCDIEFATALVIDAAEPVNSYEKRNALNTIKSARNKHLRKNGGFYEEGNGAHG
jgi:hypothetical protein